MSFKPRWHALEAKGQESDTSLFAMMPDSSKGPAMTLGNMRALSGTSIGVTCGCGQGATVEPFGWPETFEIPALHVPSASEGTSRVPIQQNARLGRKKRHSVAGHVGRRGPQDSVEHQ